MKKKICLLICVLFAVLGMVGCSGKSTDGMTNAQLSSIEKTAGYIIDSMLINLTDENYENYKDMSDFELEYEIYALNYQIKYYAEQGYDLGVDELNIEPDSFISILDAWRAAIDECGAYESRGDFQTEETSSGVTLSAEAKFEERDAEILFTFDHKMNLESMDVSAHFSVGEILTKAGLNTLLGMGTVFAVLIFLAFIISLMKYIPAMLDGSLGKKNKSVAPMTTETAESQATVIAEETDDLELIAVITAAIAAQEGTSTDGLVVRSIRRRPSNNWN